MSNRLLTVLVSTYNDRIKQLNVVLSPYHETVKYIVIHQVDNGEDYSFWTDRLETEREDVRYILSRTTGVTKSRNIALSEVDSDYALFMDDDVKVAADFYNIILSSFELYPKAGVITFCAGDVDTGEALKNYPNEAKYHTKLSILKVGTIEVAFDVSAVKSTGVQFPEYLGAGTSLPSCDEPVFLARLMAKGLRLAFVPQTIVYHPRLSSGKEFTVESALISRGVAFKDIFGSFVSIPVIFLFYLKNRGKFQLKNQSSLLALFKGYLKTKFD